MDQVIQTVSDFLQTLTWIDYVIALGVARGAFVGFKSGGFVELLRWGVLMLTLAAVVSFSGTLADYMQAHTLLSEALSEKTVIVVLGLLVFTLLRFITHLILKFASMDNNWPMKILGIVLGGLRWAVAISFALFAMNSTQLFTVDKEDLDKSRWGNAVQPMAPAIVDFATGVVPEATLGLHRVDSDEDDGADAAEDSEDAVKDSKGGKSGSTSKKTVQKAKAGSKTQEE